MTEGLNIEGLNEAFAHLLTCTLIKYP